MKVLIKKSGDNELYDLLYLEEREWKRIFDSMARRDRGEVIRDIKKSCSDVVEMPVRWGMSIDAGLIISGKSFHWQS